MNTISFMTANFVARQLNYQMQGEWNVGDEATQAYFRPIATFAERFEALLAEVQAMGFSALDIWLAHLHPTWASPEHIQIAHDLLQKYQLQVNSLAGWWGTVADFEATCKIAKALNCQILGGGSALIRENRSDLTRLLKDYDLIYGYENHAEKTPADVLKILEGDDAEGRIGLAIDTGWFGTQGYNAADATQELLHRIVYVHLKDVQAVNAHDTCRFGTGIVPVEACVRVLQNANYQGGMCIEHEPFTSNPTNDVIASYDILKQWLGI